MEEAAHRLSSYLASLRVKNAARVRSNAIISILLALLLWKTQWPSLRLGLLVLLIAYLGSALWLAMRNRRLAGEHDPLSWFNEEERSLRRMMIFETTSRMLGFLILGYGFWVATHSWPLAFLLGVAYPLITYFGLERRAYERRLRSLRAERGA